jgi:photosystem II stability/assembly factor-like uncharacterized protein
VKFNFFSPLCLLSLTLVANAQTSVFNYQGQLSENGAPAGGIYDLRFAVYGSVSGGSPLAGPLTNNAVGVTNGLFTVALDFGSAVFDGSPRWLDIGVRPSGSPVAFTVLSPRQPLTSVPYAIRALNASNLLGTLPATNLTGTLPDARLSTNVALLSSDVTFRASVTATQFNGSGAGLFNVPAIGLTGTLPDARLSANVALLTSSANFQGNVSGSNFFGNGVGLTNVPGRIFEVIPTATNIQSLANFGYLATNDTATVVVTLPVTMRVGETVRVAGSGAGGWTIAQNAGQTILFGGLADNIGVGWTPRENSRNWKAMASSVDGSKLVAVVTAGNIFTSTNYGATWTQRAINLGNQNWTCVASSGDGTKLVAGALGGSIFTSTDSGVIWTPRDLPRSWSSVASSLDGVNLVAVTSGAGQIFTSVNSGVNWTPRIGGNWSSVASSGDAVRLVATAQGGLIYTSANSGVNWTPRATNAPQPWVAVASSSDGGRLVASVNGGEIYISTDFGTNWMVTLSGSQAWTSIASSADGSKLAAIINLGSLFISTDSGTSWQQRSGLPSLGWNTVTTSADGSTLAAAGSATQIYVSSQATTTPGTAGYLSGTRLSAVELEYVGNGQFMPVSYVGTIRAR